MTIHSIWSFENDRGFILLKDESGHEKIIVSLATTIHELRQVASELKRLMNELIIKSISVFLDYEQHIYTKIDINLSGEKRGSL